MIPNDMSVADRGASRSRFQAVYKVLEDAIASRAFPGCTFGVLAEGEVQLEDGLGHFTYDEGAPCITTNTVFDIASLTKVVSTTAAAMELARRGWLNVDTPLGEILPAFLAGRPITDPASRVTLRHLLAHSSGLPGYVEFFRTEQTPDSLLSACMRLQIETEPGTRAEYSDPGFILLGKALEACIGEPLYHWVPRDIFQPLGLRDTRFNPKAEERSAIPPTEEDTVFRKRSIQGEVQDENAWVLGGAAGHAGLFSNVPDLLRFSSAILEGDKNGGGFFDAVTLARFSVRQLPAGSSRALGWDTPTDNSSAGRYFSPRSIGHLGFSGCSLWIDLDGDIAIVLLTNRTWPDRSSELIRQVRPAFHDAVRKAL